MKNIYIKRKSGFTLVEILIVTALAALLSLLVAGMLGNNLKSYRANQKSIAMEEKMAQVMREFEFSTRAASEIISAGENELIYYRYYDLDSVSPTQVRYFIEGTEFRVGRTAPFGSPPNVSYPAENEEIVLLIENLNNASSLFEYYDGSGGQLTLPVDLVKLRMIDVSLTLTDTSVTPNKSVSGSTRVSLRNMKDNL